MARILVACEESQAITKAFRKLGHEAFSCDLLPCSGGHPEWHYQQDVFEVIDKGWDLMIAHPPCTHLAVSGARWFKDKQIEQKQALNFVMELFNAPINKIALEVFGFLYPYLFQKYCLVLLKKNNYIVKYQY